MLVRVRALADGFIVAVEQDGQNLMCREPGEPTQTLTFDDATNGPLVADLRLDPYQYKLLGGTLYRGGDVVQVAPPSQAYTDYQAALSLARSLKSYVALASPTNAQTVAAVKANARLTLVLGRMLIRDIASE